MSDNRRAVPLTKLEEGLVCPITMELPVDPVFARDGFIYERVAIEEHFKGNGGKSPMSNKLIDEVLMAQPHWKRVIGNFIEHGGLISKELAEKWSKKILQQDEHEN